MAEGVPTNNQRGRRSGPCRLWGGLDKARHIVPTALLVRVQCFRKSLHKAVQGPSTRPIVVSMINRSYCRRRRRLTILGFITPSLLASASFGTFGASIFNFWNYFVWLRITDEGSVPEMRIWSILLIQSDLKWCIHLSRSLFLYSNPTRWNSVCLWPSLVCKLDHRRRPGERFL